jgi:GR25 family glycosyltransferase involved in LPS biosynthesis
MKVYVVHLKTLKHRINIVVKQLFACDFVEDVEIVTSENSDIKIATKEIIQALPECYPKQPLRSTELSLCHKFFRILQKIADNGEPAIIFEDDVLYDPRDLDHFIQEECKNLPPDWDWCFFGTGLNLVLPGVGFIENHNELKSKCADSMLVHPEAAQIIVDDLLTEGVCAAFDWDLNHRFIKHNFNVYWFEPGITKQGSESNADSSSVRHI